jgi:hypothetical protein
MIAGLICLRVGTSEGLLSTRYLTFGFHKVLSKFLKSWATGGFSTKLQLPLIHFASVEHVGLIGNASDLILGMVLGSNLVLYITYPVVSWFLLFSSGECLNITLKPTTASLTILSIRPPLWSSGQSSWLQVRRSGVRFPGTTRKKKSSGSGTGSTQPHEYNWGATWKK